MTTFDPGYGETPLPHEELDALLPAVRKVLPDPPTKADVYDLEQGFELEVRLVRIFEAANGALVLDDILSSSFARELHQELYENVWDWAGKIRKLEVSIGVAPEQITVELAQGLGSIRYRWELGHWTARQLGLAVHAEVVRVHPFIDGNGRSTRLLADLVYLAAQLTGEPSDDLAIYDWALSDKEAYIEALRHYDSCRDPAKLVQLIGVRPI